MVSGSTKLGESGVIITDWNSCQNYENKLQNIINWNIPLNWTYMLLCLQAQLLKFLTPGKSECSLNYVLFLLCSAAFPECD